MFLCSSFPIKKSVLATILLSTVFQFGVQPGKSQIYAVMRDVQNAFPLRNLVPGSNGFFASEH